MTIEHKINLCLFHDNAEWLARILATVKDNRDQVYATVADSVYAYNAPECLELVMKNDSIVAKCRDTIEDAPPFCFVDRGLAKMLAVWLRARPQDILLSDPHMDESLLMYTSKYMAKMSKAIALHSHMHWLEAVQLMLGKLRSLDARDSNMMTPLHVIARFAQLNDIAFLLLARGATYRVVDEEGQTPVSLALESGNLEFVAECVRLGLTWSCCVFERQTLAQVVVKGGNMHVLGRMLQLVKEPFPAGDSMELDWYDCLAHACYFHHLKMVTFIAEQGFVLDETSFLRIVKLQCVSRRPFVSKFQMMRTIMGCWPEYGSRTIAQGAQTYEALKQCLEKYSPMVPMVRDIELLALTGWFARSSK